jgi:hypothetical protein
MDVGRIVQDDHCQPRLSKVSVNWNQDVAAVGLTWEERFELRVARDDSGRLALRTVRLSALSSHSVFDHGVGAHGPLAVVPPFCVLSWTTFAPSEDPLSL